MTKPSVLELKRRKGARLAMLTAYDFPSARLVSEAGVDLILVGDSLGMVVLGYDSTTPVTMEDMVHHTKAARRGAPEAFLIADLPFLSYATVPDAIANAARLMKDARADSVKLEGGDEEAARHVSTLIRAGIPVLGHIGLTPQSVHVLGGYRVQGRRATEAERLHEEAGRLEAAGAFGVVLELLPRALSREITSVLSIPTIGIGSGPDVDGQVLVLPDALGLNEGFEPRFLRRFAELGRAARDGVRGYAEAVRNSRLAWCALSLGTGQAGKRHGADGGGLAAAR